MSRRNNHMTKWWQPSLLQYCVSGSFKNRLSFLLVRAMLLKFSDLPERNLTCAEPTNHNEGGRGQLEIHAPRIGEWQSFSLKLILFGFSSLECVQFGVAQFRNIILFSILFYFALIFALKKEETKIF